MPALVEAAHALTAIQSLIRLSKKA